VEKVCNPLVTERESISPITKMFKIFLRCKFPSLMTVDSKLAGILMQKNIYYSVHNLYAIKQILWFVYLIIQVIICRTVNLNDLMRWVFQRMVVVYWLYWIKSQNKMAWFGLWCLTPLSTIFQLYIMVVSFISGGNQSTRRKPLTCCKWLTNFIT
jgi:hypothetical protein